MVGPCDVPRGALAAYCGRLAAPAERRACESGGAAWAFLSATPARGDVPSAATALRFCAHATGEAPADERAFVDAPRACADRADERGGAGGGGVLAACFHAAQSAVPSGCLALFGGCEFSTCSRNESLAAG